MSACALAFLLLLLFPPSLPPVDSSGAASICSHTASSWAFHPPSCGDQREGVAKRKRKEDDGSHEDASAGPIRKAGPLVVVLKKNKKAGGAPTQDQEGREREQRRRDREREGRAVRAYLEGYGLWIVGHEDGCECEDCSEGRVLAKRLRKMSRDKRKKEVARVRLKRQMAERLRRGFLGLGSAPGGESEEGAGEAEGGALDGAAAVRVPKAAKPQLRGIHKEAWDLAESQSVARTADGTGGLPAWLAAERAASEARAAAGSSGGGAGPGFLNLSGIQEVRHNCSIEMRDTAAA
eukprot:SM000306S11738  [mRNA]  locus=s306:27504:28726:+ [translate_table: standard]